MVYIAQPPLYEVRLKGQSKSEYVLKESYMRGWMLTRGLEGTELIIAKDGAGKESKRRQGKAGKTGKVVMRKISDGQLANLVKLLADVERITAVLARRGIDFTDFVQAYYDGRRLPLFRIRIEGQYEVFYDKTAYEKRLDELKDRIKFQAEGDHSSSIVAEELHELGRVNQINEKLKAEFKLDLSDFLLKPAKSVSGEELPTKFSLINGQDRYNIASLGGICSAARQIGGKGIEIKRFKGLGEMNAEQLWQTTMNPATRTLLSVKLDDAGEADRLFSILMGSDVEKRRNFISNHALEVQNLDI
jgi:DNA gyrase subunit B